MSGTRCYRIQEDIVGLLEGTAPPELADHVAGCDACRDARHDLESVTRAVAKAGDDFAPSAALADRLAAIALEAAGQGAAPTVVSADTGDVRERTSETRMRPSSPVIAKPIPTAAPVSRPKASKKAVWLIVAACASVGGSIAAGLIIADRHAKSPELAATRAWHGKITKISRSGADKTGGFTIVNGSNKAEVAEGGEIKAGMQLVTDGRTRARIELDDGSFVVLDRATTVKVDAAPRTLVLEDGALIADVAHVANAPPAKVKTASGWVKVLGTKLAVTAAADRTNVEVLRGEVEVGGAGGKSEHVSAGQEGVMAKDGRIDVAPANDLAQRAAFGEQLLATHNEDTDAPVSGLGELRARRPGKTDEKDHAVRLAQHAVKVRIAGAVARTEVDEVFTNDTADELEGIYRFPLPPGAQIERLALEVDGKLVDGEFIDKAKAAAIWRGAIQNAAPTAPRPKEELVWVPGPWHDPALLEWQRGGRFELKIFPIPKKGSRRVVIAYTETVAPVSGVRRYVYPLPQGSSSQLTIDNFTMDAQVVGHEAKAGVKARGYELEKRTEGNAERLTAAMTAFTPSGDLAIEYALDDKDTDATAWAYRDTSPPVTETKTSANGKKETIDPIGADPFVAIAIRPKLPKWADMKPRDQVIVVDSGRAMFGERFARAKRLAVQMTQEMDRRDRVTVLACDIGCKTMPGGFAAPGAPAAHDVDAFLASVTPDGASDLVGAVRAASNASGHEKERDLRVVLVSDGVATAGYRTGSRVADEVSDVLADTRGEVVSVPLGADADTALLGEISRGGGGVVVPYQPGQRLESTALEVLNATYGTTLRDVEVVLPPGLRDAAPAKLAPLRAGSETIVTARLSGDVAKGDVIVKGKVGGDPFEAKYPIDVRASTDAGNAFVPRLFAAARIADRERETQTETVRTELVALSRRFAVPSKHTSLLVLESEAMFKAFGIERGAHSPQWTGEAVSQGYLVPTVANATVGHGALALIGTGAGGGGKGAPTDISASNPFDAFGADPIASDKSEKEAAKKDSSSLDAPRGEANAGPGLGGFAQKAPMTTTPAATSTAAPAPPPAKPRSAPAADEAPFAVDPSASRRRISGGDWDGGFDRRRGGRFMKRVFVRKASIGTDPTPAVTADKVAQARAGVLAAPDERSKHKELARVLALSGQLDELGEILEKWSTRDPLDQDVIVGRADLAARKGDRDASLRIMSGALAASALTPQDAFVLATTVARGFERAGRPEACAFTVTAAELRPTDTDALARAISCERSQGKTKTAERWLVGLKDTQRTQISQAITKLDAAKAEAPSGDVVVKATWDGGADLDIALLDPAGRRAGVATRMKGARIEGAQARDHETLGLATSESGAFVVEMVRAQGTEATSAVSGRVTITAFGQTQTVPFTLTGARAQVARVDVKWEPQLVEVDDDRFGGGVREFDRGAAAGALARVSVSHCAVGGQSGTGHAMVTFSTTGRVSEVVIDDTNFAGTGTGRCVQTAFFNATVSPFTGSAVRVGKSFTINAR